MFKLLCFDWCYANKQVGPFEAAVTVRQCQAIQQCHTYLLTYLLPDGYPDTRSGTRVTAAPRLSSIYKRTGDT